MTGADAIKPFQKGDRSRKKSWKEKNVVSTTHSGGGANSAATSAAVIILVLFAYS